MTTLIRSQWVVREVMLDTQDHTVSISVASPDDAAGSDIEQLKGFFRHLHVTAWNDINPPLYTVWLKPTKEYWKMLKNQFDNDPEFLTNLQRNINERMK